MFKTKVPFGEVKFEDDDDGDDFFFFAMELCFPALRWLSYSMLSQLSPSINVELVVHLFQ